MDDGGSERERPVRRLRATVCVAGGGPAGMMAGLLFARAGIDVIVLEKHADFLRDFRGDTVHPSTLEVLEDLGLVERFFERPHQKIKRVRVRFGGETFIVGDFTKLRTRYPYIALIPQWDFLDLLAKEAKTYPSFELLMPAKVTDLIEADGRVRGVRALTSGEELEIRSELVIGADGRHSTVRGRARLLVNEIGAPIDVLWMRLSREPSDPSQLYGIFDRGEALVMIDRGQYFQCGYLIEKGALERIRKKGLPWFQERILSLAPFLGSRVAELKSWDDIKLLNVQINRLRRWWRPGLLCIGDAAHAMSPVGGVGVNLAIQDAVAAANILIDPLLKGELSARHLRAVQKRRTLPVVLTQKFQEIAQRKVIGHALSVQQRAPAPWFFRVLNRWPALRRLPAWWIGFGVRPERVRARRPDFIRASPQVSAGLQ